MNDNKMPLKVIFYSEPDNTGLYFKFEMSNYHR